MIHFFGDPKEKIYAVQTSGGKLTNADKEKLTWLFSEAPYLDEESISGHFVGPRAVMVSPWSTNAVEIAENMAMSGIKRIEEYIPAREAGDVDPMLQQEFSNLDQQQFDVDTQSIPVQDIEDIEAYNQQEGLSLSQDEVEYLDALSRKLDRKLTDSEVFGFSQVNSEHCRHKIFNGSFVIDGEEKENSLFALIKKTTKENRNEVVSAYKDNVAFIAGPTLEQWAPTDPSKPAYYENTTFDSVVSIKAETHNFPTTVEPFMGAATGSGGEIRDRLAGGQGSLPLAGSAVYMTAYSRLGGDRRWEKKIPARDWLYQTPKDILIKASNGASDFGNKFGQPLINGSVLTFEHQEHGKVTAFDKVIMQAGGVGYGKAEQAIKQVPAAGDDIVVIGGENYRIGMGGAAVSSANTGAMDSQLELNAVQRSNPEMQKRAANAIRGMVEQDVNPIKSIHDHGAGGHLNCLSELVEDTGGTIDVRKLPVGDPSLSAREIIGNESQERMGLVIDPKDKHMLEEVAARERAPLYSVGKVTNDNKFTFSEKDGKNPMELALEDMFGSSPKTVLTDTRTNTEYAVAKFTPGRFKTYLQDLLKLESVACKDWLTNKVDRCVTGRVAKQQTCGAHQLPLNNVGVVALDYTGKYGAVSSMGHAPIASLLDPIAGAQMSIGRALTNMVFAPIQKGLGGVSLSANWMWPANNEGENARLYDAVQSVSDTALALGINIPTGKDSLSMKQKYPDQEVLSPGTVVISAAAVTDDIKRVVEPVMKQKVGSKMYWVNLSGERPTTAGTAAAQTRNAIGGRAAGIANMDNFKAGWNLIQDLIRQDRILAGHDIASGGAITSILEMCFPSDNVGVDLDLEFLGGAWVDFMLSENCGVLLQSYSDLSTLFRDAGVQCWSIGSVNKKNAVTIKAEGQEVIKLKTAEYRRFWMETSFLLDVFQSGHGKAQERYENVAKQPLKYKFPRNFSGDLPTLNGPRPKAAIIREKGSNSEREMARAMWLAGFDVMDIHMTDLVHGRTDLSSVQFIAAVGGFSNSDVLGSAKGWAGAFKYNKTANDALRAFYDRDDTLSLGVCNGCQLFMELDLIYPEADIHPKMGHNDSKKFECTFSSVEIQENNSVMLGNMAGQKLGIWSAHGEGKFNLEGKEEEYVIPAKYAYEGYPANPNGSDYNAAMLSSKDGRHLAMMPHLERSIFPWNWPYYPERRKSNEVTPWLQAFVNAREWIESRN